MRWGRGLLPKRGVDEACGHGVRRAFWRTSEPNLRAQAATVGRTSAPAGKRPRPVQDPPANIERDMKKGLFITFEGNEGSGKSTQILLLYRELKRRHLPVILTREPGGTRTGDEIRRVLLDGRNHAMTPLCETFLYMASRAQLTAEVILPALKKGQIVLCDRWLDATVAYQGHAGGQDMRWIRDIGRKATQGVSPNLTLFLDLPVAVGLKRRKKARHLDRIERKALAYHEKVRKGYLRIAAAEPRRFKRLPVRESDSVQTVYEKVKRMALRALGKRS